MNPVAELIDTVLAVIGSQFYADSPREFARDRRALMQAIARYGHECQHRGWHLEPEFIQRDLIRLLNEIKRADADITYLPVYLEGCVRKHIGQRAEELQARARQVAPRVKRVIEGTQSVVIVQPTAVEQMGTLYADLRLASRARRQRRAKPAKGAAKQPQLF